MVHVCLDASAVGAELSHDLGADATDWPFSAMFPHPASRLDHTPTCAADATSRNALQSDNMKPQEDGRTSLPVLTHLSILPMIPLFTNPARISLVRGSSTCSCVARSLLSLSCFSASNFGLTATPGALAGGADDEPDPEAWDCG